MQARYQPYSTCRAYATSQQVTCTPTPTAPKIPECLPFNPVHAARNRCTQPAITDPERRNKRRPTEEAHRGYTICSPVQCAMLWIVVGEEVYHRARGWEGTLLFLRIFLKGLSRGSVSGRRVCGMVCGMVCGRDGLVCGRWMDGWDLSVGSILL